jgi:nucleotide-binding universal stress UspA family protein
MSVFKTILVPVDFSPASERAFRFAWSLASEYGSHLIVLHVPEPAPLASYSELEKAIDHDSGYRHRLEMELRKYQPGYHFTEVEHRLQLGDPADEIVRTAAETPCDLIVMGTHGRQGLERLLIGSVTTKVLRRARCPVLVVNDHTMGAVPERELPQPAKAAF